VEGEEETVRQKRCLTRSKLNIGSSPEEKKVILGTILERAKKIIQEKFVSLRS
jgi:hypothetical protein